MNVHQDHEFEQDLRRVRPAAPPAGTMQRLLAARAARQSPRPSVAPRTAFWPLLLRWLVPATAVLIAAFVVGRLYLPRDPAPPRQNLADVAPVVTADNVELDQELVRSFDTVALLPGGEPVRFRCREWRDEVILRGKDRSVVIEQRTPRIEVIPVRFETY
ncbi:MAG TPA: hypothetical protein VJA21_27230 [Verrucomicrobiae bacterium]